MTRREISVSMISRRFGQLFCYTSLFPSNRRLRVVLDGTRSQECEYNLRFTPSPSLRSTHFFLHFNNLHDTTICNVAINCYSKLSFSGFFHWNMMSGTMRNWVGFGMADLGYWAIQIVSFDRFNLLFIFHDEIWFGCSNFWFDSLVKVLI